MHECRLRQDRHLCISVQHQRTLEPFLQSLMESSLSECPQRSGLGLDWLISELFLFLVLVQIRDGRFAEAFSCREV